MLTSMAKVDEGRKKIRARLCHCFGEKEYQSVISPSIALLNSSLKNSINNDLKYSLLLSG
jgi:hypothetical protein